MSSSPGRRRIGRRTVVVAAVAVALLLIGGGVAVARVVLAAPATRVAVSVPGSSTGYGAPVRIGVRLTSDGRPLAGSVRVSVAGSRPAAQQTVRTDSQGRGTLSVPAGALSVGPHTVTASYAATSEHAATTTAVRLTVVAASATVTLTTPPDANGVPTLQAAVTTSSGIPAAGKVQFTVGGQPVATVAVANGVATTPAPAGLALGDHDVAASFTPSDTRQVSTARASSTMSVTKASATVGAATTTPAVRYGDKALVDVAVTAGSNPTGAVTIADGATPVATGTTDASGHASLSFLDTADPGTKSYTVSFGGNDTTTPASASLTVQTTTTNVDIVVTKPATLTPGTDAALTVAVVGTPQKPTGSVTVAYDGTQIAAGPLDAQGAIAATAKAVPAGDHTITVTYAGDVRFQPATSSATLTASTAPANPNAAGAAGINANNPCPPAAAACVDLSNTVAWLQSGGQVTYGPVKITSGKAGARTDTGMFTVYWRDKNHRSSIFNDAPMPNSVFFDGGIAFHQGSLSVQSNGCIHLSSSASLTFFDTLAVGDKVYVFGTPPY